MKTILLPLFLFLITLSIHSQAPIPNFESTDGSEFLIVTSSSVDQSASGANLVWTFNDLNKDGTSIDSNRAPIDPDETSVYAGTTDVTVSVANMSSENKMLLKKDPVGGTQDVFFTGLLIEGLNLNYGIDNAFMGNFPMNFSDPIGTADVVDGTFQYIGAITVDGIIDNDDSKPEIDSPSTILANVDAHGTLTLNNACESGDDCDSSFNGAVTRLKVVQTLNLFVPAFNLYGTAAQTSYYYYDDSNGNLVFRTSRIVITSALLNDDITIMEVLTQSTLSNEEAQLAEASLTISENPVKDVLKLSLGNGATINAIAISDITGRQVLNKKTNATVLNVAALTSGIYIATITTDRGIASRKFVKK
ncbi:T9SS type A sorting domain-containing protein [Algibacter sp. 2305UL17-15]|uniref:T9SS type A sorting domain-containing protein n=1 Tax=Algibacter sp. 2305UL17-15 TaxID=3231268 RepID=UPI00345A70D3